MTRLENWLPGISEIWLEHESIEQNFDTARPEKNFLVEKERNDDESKLFDVKD